MQGSRCYSFYLKVQSQHYNSPPSHPWAMTVITERGSEMESISAFYRTLKPTKTNALDIHGQDNEFRWWLWAHNDTLVIRGACYHRHRANPACGNLTLSASTQLKEQRWRSSLKDVARTRASWKGGQVVAAERLEGKSFGAPDGRWWRPGTRLWQRRWWQRSRCGKGSTRSFSHVLNETTKKGWKGLSFLPGPDQERNCSICDEDNEHNEGPEGEKWSHSFTGLLRKDPALEMSISKAGK